MGKIAVIADSSCDYTPERAKQAGFSVIPLGVTFEDGTTYRDGVDLSGEQFFQKLAASKTLPKTSQPTLDDWMEEFRRHEDCDDIICITVSSKLSGSIGGASMARRLLREDGFQPHIHLIDSLNASAAVALFAVEAARMAKMGKLVQEILVRMTYLQSHVGIYFIIDTLDYLRKGGRIGSVTMLAGKLMGIKPLMTLSEGEATSIDKVRGIQAGCKKLVDGFLKNAADLHRVTVISSCAPERVQTITRMLQTHISDIEITSVEIGAVIGTYIGPGGTALAYEEKQARW